MNWILRNTNLVMARLFDHEVSLVPATEDSPERESADYGTKGGTLASHRWLAGNTAVPLDSCSAAMRTPPRRRVILRD
jgi:hypothetical protein